MGMCSCDMMPSERAAQCPSDATACSPSSDTPETDAVWKKHLGLSALSAASAYELAMKLERERDHSRRMQKKLADTIKLITSQRYAAIEKVRQESPEYV